MTTSIFIVSIMVLAGCLYQVSKHGSEIWHPQTNIKPIRSLKSHQLALRRQKVYRLYLSMAREGNAIKIAQAKLILRKIDQASSDIMVTRFDLYSISAQ